MTLTGKDVGDGSVGSNFIYRGTTATIATYCKDYVESVSDSALIVTNLRTMALSSAANYSHLVASLRINGRLISQDFAVERQVGGICMIMASSETTLAGTIPIQGGVG